MKTVTDTIKILIVSVTDKKNAIESRGVLEP